MDEVLPEMVTVVTAIVELAGKEQLYSSVNIHGLQSKAQSQGIVHSKHNQSDQRIELQGKCIF